MEQNGHEWMSNLVEGHRARGRSEAFIEDFVKGLAKGHAKAVLILLGVRGFSVSDDDRDRINNCTDIDQFDHWLKCAVTAQSAEEFVL
ncbi:hypothetical protein AGRA3207_004342 [Actinomadura graeca]|uniref:Uncharacterized protein n=1 Tax=Actinomadura graeca TaxID=2750812 RepID=A0ABX8R2I9_9ACTN|nr:hypothetical protein [Actinomadura graeca]QXJ23213.1 hypothetical protein AGRA3207_004342 [Actinomadura graeca]